MTSTLREMRQNLPALRRYARALTGTQDKGDRQVARFAERLECAIAPSPQADPKLELFRAFHASLDPAQAPPPARQVFLLAGIERFSFPDIAYAMGIDEPDARRHYCEAQDDVTRLTPSRIMIVEDEPIIALDLAELSRDMGHTVTGIADNEATAGALAAANPPQLILADVRLKRGDSGIEAVRAIEAARSTPAIFITAFPEQLLTGRRAEPDFVIPKPYEADTVQAAIFQALVVNGVGLRAAA
jgi:CheY-like chemotaxis protein